MDLITTLIQSPIDDRDYIYEGTGLSATIPETLDMRDEILAVRNQGADGACVAFTASCIKEVQEKRDVDFNEYMSPQFIYLNREDKSTEGMYSRDLMRILTNIGSIPETMMPYQQVTEITSNMISAAANYRINGYAAITTIDGLKDALVNNGPALLAIPIYNYGQYLWEQGDGDYFRGGHAVTVVGWTTEGFIIRNSWGAAWNGDGHTIFPFSHWGMQWEVWTTVDAESSVVVVVEEEPKITPRELRRIREAQFRKAQEVARLKRIELFRKFIADLLKKRKVIVIPPRQSRRPRRPRPRRRRNISEERMRRARQLNRG